MEKPLQPKSFLNISQSINLKENSPDQEDNDDNENSSIPFPRTKPPPQLQTNIKKKTFLQLIQTTKQINQLHINHAIEIYTIHI